MARLALKCGYFPIRTFAQNAEVVLQRGQSSRACDDRTFQLITERSHPRANGITAKDSPILFGDGIDVGNAKDMMLSEVEFQKMRQGP